MGVFTLGGFTTVPVSERPDLVGESVFAMLQSLGLAQETGVVEIDPDISDTAATQREFGLGADDLVNCVIVTGRRDGVERTAACLVTAATRADINGLVKRRLDVRKASFMSREDAVETTGMEFGGITPIGLPHGWPILIDGRIPRSSVVIIGSGVRRSKILIPGALLAELPGAEVIDGLGREVPAT